MDKLSFMRLWDLYHGILTPTQQEINLDLTLSEIAESKGISRQGVSECLNKCKKQLEEYEKKLCFSQMLTAADLHSSFLVSDVGRWAEEFLKLHPEYAEDIAKLSDILNRDYNIEVRSAINKINKV